MARRAPGRFGRLDTLVNNARPARVALARLAAGADAGLGADLAQVSSRRARSANASIAGRGGHVVPPELRHYSFGA
jgi:hypothetical protein